MTHNMWMTIVMVVLLVDPVAANVANDIGGLKETKLLKMFEAWMHKFGKDKVYGHNPLLKLNRFKTFKNNVQYVLRHNKISSSSYKLGINCFADITFDEALTSLLVGHRKDGFKTTKHNRILAQEQPPTSPRPCNTTSQFDWRSQNVVTPVKDQGQCGSCWAFATVAAIESAHAIKTGRLLRLSEQELVSCETKYSNGCAGGSKGAAMQWVVKNKGIDSQLSYPYFSGITKSRGTCNFKKAHTHKVATISRVVTTPMANEVALLCAVAKQPVTVSLFANNDFLRYSNGIFDANKSCPYQIGTSNHAVTFVGWGQNLSGVKYWIVKNSWGRSWGMDGYAYIKRGGSIPHGVCGVNNNPIYPII